MRVVVQRVKEASVKVDSQIVGAIGKGMLVFLAVGKDDTEKDLDFLVNKVAQLRVFEDNQGKMNLSAQETPVEFLVVSQFTLLGDCDKGRRPSFDKAAEPKKAEDFYNQFVAKLRAQKFKVETGVFRAMMEVSLINDGPVTFIVDSRP
jgi:D-tyrosyl-tRNA(Tyr) deacylase